MILRGVFYIASLVSFVLCVTAGTLWATGYNKPLGCFIDAWCANISSRSGSFLLVFSRGGDDADMAVSYQFAGITRIEMNRGPTDGDIPRRRRQDEVHTTVIVVHAAYFVVLFALLPIWSGRVIYLQRRRKRQSRGEVCSTCAYDLTGNTSGVCPECGTRIASAPVPEPDAHAARCG